MNIAYHCTDNYARITATSIVSVFENNKDFKEINIYIIENGFSQATKDKFSSLASRYRRKVFFIPLPDLNKEYGLGLVYIKKKWVFDSYSRLFLDKLLPKDVKKVIYLDGDTLVLDSLRKLWEVDLKGKCCAACLDCMSEPYYNLFEIDKSSRYCNSGLLLIDLESWKEKNIGEKIRNYVNKHHGYVFFMEQTVLNVVLQNEIRHLPAEYNVSSLEQIFSYKELVKLRKPLHFYSAEDIKKAKEKPIVVHMTSVFYIINRAWNKVTNHPERDRFVEYSKILGWDGEILQTDQRNLKARAKDWAIHILPKPLLIECVSVLYNNIRTKNIARISRKVM